MRALDKARRHRPGQTVTETTASRLQWPSYFTGAFTSASLSIAETKFITQNDTAVTELKLTNTGTDPITRTISVQSPIGRPRPATS